MTQRFQRSLVILLAGACFGIAALTGCSDSSSGASGASTTTTTAASASDVKITSLTAPASVDCNGKTSVDITIGYAVEGATKQQLLVDGRQVDGITEPSASVTTWVHCDSLPHTIVVVGYDARDRHTSKQAMLTTNM
jgi:hypothetical protein